MYNKFLLVISQVFSGNSANILIEDREYTFSFNSISKNWTIKSKIHFSPDVSNNYVMKEAQKIKKLKLDSTDSYLEVSEELSSVYLVQHTKNLSKFMVFKRFMENYMKVRSFWTEVLVS